MALSVIFNLKMGGPPSGVSDEKIGKSPSWLEIAKPERVGVFLVSNIKDV